MQLKYRVLSADAANMSIVVRYYTDILSEADLRQNPNDTSVKPLRCRTDYNLTLYRDYDADSLHIFIVSCAPIAWLSLMEDKKNGTSASLDTAKLLVGVEKTEEIREAGK